MALITKAPTINSRAELLAFLELNCTLRPLAKVVSITDSILRKQQHFGMMTRKRIGAKDANKWRQFIEAEDKHSFSFHKFLVDDRKLKDTTERRVKFEVVGWREK